MKFYVEMKPTNSPWLGEVPEHWELSRFRYEAKINGGQVDPREEPFSKMTLIAPNHIESNTGRILSVETAEAQGADSGKYLVERGQLVYSKIRPALNKAAIAETDALCSADMYPMTFTERVDPRFALYYLLARPFHTFATILSMRVKMPKVNREELADAPWLVPTLDEQRAIVDYLDLESARIDTLIEQQRCLIDMLDERRASLISQETGWGASRPNHWPMMRLSWLFQATGSGTTPANEDITYGKDAEVPWVTTGELREAIIFETERGISSDVARQYSALKVHPAGSLLIAMYGATIGRMALLGIAATSNQACCALIGPTRADPEFVQYSLMAAKNWLLLEAAGGGQPNINQDKIRSFRIPAPALEEQRHVAAYLNEQTANIDKLIVEAKLFIELSRERRSALITAAVTGQIDVRETV